MMTYAILKAQGETGEVAAVEADAAEGKISARNASVTDAAFSGDTVSFTYAPLALPIAADQDYRDAEKLFPISAELNREIIRVGGLSDGMYTIKMDGTTTATVSAADLAAGVNIADKKGNPSQLQSLSVKAIADVRQKIEVNYRKFMVLEANTIYRAQSIKLTVSATKLCCPPHRRILQQMRATQTKPRRWRGAKIY